MAVRLVLYYGDAWTFEVTFPNVCGSTGDTPDATCELRAVDGELPPENATASRIAWQFILKIRICV